MEEVYIPKCRKDDNIKIALNEIVFGVWTSFIWLKGIEPVPGTYEQRNGILGLIKGV